MSQNEIDSLLSEAALAVPGKKASASTQTLPKAAPKVNFSKSYKLYDFRRPEKLSKEQLRSLRSTFGRFTRSASNHLAALTRSSADAKLVEVDQTSYGQLFRTHGIPTLICLFKLNDTIPGILKLNLSQLFSALDRIMGGPGSGTIITRPLTEFERSLMADICGQLLGLWVNEFQGNTPSLELEMIDTDERMIPRSLNNDEFMVRGLYDLRLGSSNGQISIYTPLRDLNELMGRTGQSTGKIKDPSKKRTLSQNFKLLPLHVSVDLGSAWMTAGEMANLKVGDTIRLQQHESQPLKVCVGGKPRFRGRPGIQGRKMAIQIEGPYEERP